MVGHRLHLRIHDDRIEAYLGGSFVLTLPRGRRPKGTDAAVHVVDYRHIIAALRAKPGALANLAYRDALWPRAAYRRAWEALIAAGSPRDVQLAVKSGADVIVVDGMQGGTAATQDVFIEHAGIPTLAATRLAVDALQELGMHREVQLIVSGGIRTGADVAKALALGADAVSIGVAAMIALGDNAPEHDAAYRALGSAAGYYDDYQAGLDPAGISTQEEELAARLDPVEGGRRLANYLRTLVLETQTLARACGKSHVHNLEPEDLVALTIEAAAMARVPLAGTGWIPGRTAV